MAQVQASLKLQTPTAAATPAAPGARSEADKWKLPTGFEGREDELGRSLSILLRLLGNHTGYAHELNDPLVKAHLLAIQFAKDQGRLAEYVAHDVKTMQAITLRMRPIIEKSGDKEIALVALFDRTACHYALALTSGGEGLRRSWQEPFGHVLRNAQKIGQFPDLTVEEIHAQWTRPRLVGYARDMGVGLAVSDIGADGTITAEVAG